MNQNPANTLTFIITLQIDYRHIREYLNQNNSNNGTSDHQGDNQRNVLIGLTPNTRLVFLIIENGLFRQWFTTFIGQKIHCRFSITKNEGVLCFHPSNGEQYQSSSSRMHGVHPVYYIYNPRAWHAVTCLGI